VSEHRGTSRLGIGCEILDIWTHCHGDEGGRGATRLGSRYFSPDGLVTFVFFGTNALSDNLWLLLTSLVKLVVVYTPFVPLMLSAAFTLHNGWIFAP
jgi:hypothetical protein